MVIVNIQKKDLFLITAIAIFLIGSGIVIAYGGTQPSVVGHSSREVSGTVLGACNVICDPGSSKYSGCVDYWGGAVCNGQVDVSSCDSGLTRCTCPAGSVGHVMGRSYTYGYFGTWTGSNQVMAYQILCVTS